MFILCGIEFFFSARATIKSNSHSIYILYLSLTNIYFLFLADIFFLNFKQTLFHFIQIDIQKYYSYKFLFSFIMNAILFFFFFMKSIRKLSTAAYAVTVPPKWSMVRAEGARKSEQATRKFV